jgi:hypothetical protein
MLELGSLSSLFLGSDGTKPHQAGSLLFPFTPHCSLVPYLPPHTKVEHDGGSKRKWDLFPASEIIVTSPFYS